MTHIEKLLEVAQAEVGYLEKKTNSNLQDKTANAGYNNYTKYAYDIDKQHPTFYNGPKNGFAWCDVFVDWCFITAFGEDKAKKLLCQPAKSCGAGCYYSAQYYKNNSQFYTTPKAGDQIFFKDSCGDPCHTGIVYKVTSTTVYTIEGNTSSAAGVVANGGCVAKKSYSLSYNRIYGYGRPKYDTILGKTTTATTTTKTTTTTTKKTTNTVKETGDKNVKAFQTWLNKNFASKLDVDGEYGSKTKTAAIKALQKTLGGLSVDGSFGSKTKSACAKANIKEGAKGNLVYILQGMLYSLKYDPKGFDGKFGPGCTAAVKKFQKAKGLTADGVVGSNTWSKIFA